MELVNELRDFSDFRHCGCGNWDDWDGNSSGAVAGGE